MLLLPRVQRIAPPPSILPAAVHALPRGASGCHVRWETHSQEARRGAAPRPSPNPWIVMAKRPNVSAGLLLYRRSQNGLEVFLAHPGGPFWKDKEAGAWTIPKGVLDPDEDPLDAARREFAEETGIQPRGPFIPLGTVRQRAGKTIHAWAWEGDADASTTSSNDMRTEWPRGSGRWITFPEVDRCAWFDPVTAKSRINPAQAELIDRLEVLLAAGGVSM
jgi:predicted NUDIX family NTP pyrophosphohydrolase